MWLEGSRESASNWNENCAVECATVEMELPLRQEGRHSRQGASISRRGAQSRVGVPKAVHSSVNCRLLFHLWSPPRMSGMPSLLEPMTTTLALSLLARSTVASIPFHLSSRSSIPLVTIF